MRQSGTTEQAGTPMAVQGEEITLFLGGSVAMRTPLPFAKNILAEGFAQMRE